jgi:hypothetical protein
MIICADARILTIYFQQYLVIAVGINGAKKDVAFSIDQ